MYRHLCEINMEEVTESRKHIEILTYPDLRFPAYKIPSLLSKNATAIKPQLPPPKCTIKRNA